MNECQFKKIEDPPLGGRHQTSWGITMKTSRLSNAAMWSSASICVIYFGLLWGSVSARAFLGALVAPGLSVGIALTLFGIVAAIGLTWWFVRDASARDSRSLGE